jgi:putative salt-induced outer membrane protein YdiY
MKKLFIITLAALACSAWADRIDLKSGSFLTGKVKSVTKDAVVFTSDDLGDVTVKVANIVKLDVGERVVQRNDLSEEKKALVVEKGAYVVNQKPLDMGDVKAIDPVPEKWHGAVTVAYNATRGNTYENSATVLLNVNRRWESDRFRGDFGYYYGESAKAHEDRQKTTDKWEVELQHDHFWLPKVYHYENVKWERDMIQLLRARYRVGLGGGYQWLENRQFGAFGKWSFNQELGVNWIREDYENSSKSQEGGFCALRYAHHLLWTPSNVTGLSFFHNAEILPEVDEWEKFLVKADVGFSAPLVYDWTINAKIEWEYNSKPANDRLPNDVRYIVGLGYKW